MAFSCLPNLAYGYFFRTLTQAHAQVRHEKKQDKRQNTGHLTPLSYANYTNMVTVSKYTTSGLKIIYLVDRSVDRSDKCNY